MRPLHRLIAAASLVAALAAGAGQMPPLSAQIRIAPATPEDSRTSLRRALAQQKAAEARASALEREATQAGEAAQKAASEAAALAARIQASEAQLAAMQARLQMIDGQKRAVQARLAHRQQPVVRLTAALQNLARRPVALALLRPGSLQDMVYLRAALASTLPEVQARTADLRAELDNLRQLEAGMVDGLAALRQSETELDARRKEMSALAARQRLLARGKGATATRESDRALALAEEARDLDALAGRLDAAGRLRRELEALPGPILRPAWPEQARVAPDEAESGALGGRGAAAEAAPVPYQLPVIGRVVAGFGSLTPSGTRGQGLALAPAPRAQVVAPSRGRVAFAGPYRGYGRIVILEHAGGWTSLITGLGQVDVAVGQEISAGAPIGLADAAGTAAVVLELRQNGEPVNPIDHLR